MKGEECFTEKARVVNKDHGWYGGFELTIVYGDDVKLRSVLYTAYNNFGEVSGTYTESYICHEDGRAIGLGEQSGRHTDYNLMIKGLAKANIMNPSIDKYLSRNDVS